MTDYQRYIIRFLDDLNGYTNREVFEVVDEDDEFYLCVGLQNKKNAVFNKSEIYHIMRHRDTISLFGFDEEILNFILLKVYASDAENKEKYEEAKMLSSKIRTMKKRYQYTSGSDRFYSLMNIKKSDN